MTRAPFFASSSERNNAALFDEWTFVHIAAGAGAAALDMSAWEYMFASVIYEVGEHLHESPSGSRIFGTKGPEWDLNVLTDVAVGLGAYALTAWGMGRMPGHK